MNAQADPFAVLAQQLLKVHLASESPTPQSTYYWRKKAGMVGSRRQPNRQWRINIMTDEQREAHIQECGRQMLKAYNEGNREVAMYWLQAEITNIKARSVAQVAKLEGCFFDAKGEADRTALVGVSA